MFMMRKCLDQCSLCTGQKTKNTQLSWQIKGSTVSGERYFQKIMESKLSIRSDAEWVLSTNSSSQITLSHLEEWEKAGMGENVVRRATKSLPT